MTRRSVGIPKSMKVIAAAADFGAAPMLDWVDIAKLVIDEDYQRDLRVENWNAIRRIATRFTWSRFSPVFVAPVEGGQFAIIDGQHRVHAAMARGITRVPCQIVQMTPEEQAASFAAVNGMVTKVTTWNILKAALAAKEEWALAARRVCEDAGCRLMTSNSSAATKKAGEIYSVALIRKGVTNGQAASMTAALRAIRQSTFGREAAAYGNEVLRPVFEAMAAVPWLTAIAADALATCLDAVDLYAIADRADAETKQRRRTGGEPITRYELIAADIGAALDKAFPQRIRMPEAAS